MSNEEILIKKFLFENEEEKVREKEKVKRSSNNKMENFFGLSVFQYFLDHPKVFVFAKFLIGFIFLGIPLAIFLILIKRSIDNPNESKLAISGVLLVISNILVLIYILFLIVCKIMNILRSK